MTAEKITLSQLEQYLAKAAWILKGPVDASDFKVNIFPMLFFKRMCDVWNEEHQKALDDSDGDIEYAEFAENYRFQVPPGAHWNDVRETTQNVGLAIENALRGIERANQAYLSGIFGDAQWSNKNKLSDKLLLDLIEHFSQYTLGNANVDPDMLGQAYQPVPNAVHLATLQEIAANDDNLNIPLYVEKQLEDTPLSVDEALADPKAAWQASQAAESHFKAVLEKFLA